MSRRGEAVWQAPHNEPQRSQRVRQALPKGASRGELTQFAPAGDAVVLLHHRCVHKSEALSERDLIRGSLGLLLARRANGCLAGTRGKIGAGDAGGFTDLVNTFRSSCGRGRNALQHGR